MAVVVSAVQETDVVLRDGSTVHVRSAGPPDEQPIRAFLSGLEYLASVEVSWARWFILAGPPNMMLLLIAWIALMVVRRPEASVGRSIPTLRQTLAAAEGPATRAEIATAMTVGVALILWVSEPLTGLNGGLIGLAVVAALFMPPFRVIRMGALGDAVPWGPVALFFAALLLGSAITATAAFDPIVRSVFESLGIGRLPLMPTVAVAVVIALFGHLVFTSTTAYATVIVPVAAAMAAAGGLPPAAVALPVAITIGYAFMLPMNTVPSVVMLEAGYFSAREMLGYGTIITLAAAAVLLLVAMPYWQMLGLFGA